MTMPSSGVLNMAGTSSPVSVAQELGLGLTTLITMNDSAVRTLAGAGGSGTAWSMNSLYGKSNRVAKSVTISANTTNYTLNTAAVSGYVAGKTDVTLTVNSGIYLYSTSTGTPALTVTGFTTGDTVTIVNNGYIMGMGGAGGGSGTSASVALAGGNAISLAFSVSITNNSYIGGGGGGGGRGSSYGSGGGGAGGGKGGDCGWQTTITGPTGGAVGASGGNGQSQLQNGGKAGTVWVGTGGAGGRIMPGTGGIGGAGPSSGGYGRGGGSGGGGASEDSSVGQGGAGGTAGAAGTAGASLAAGGGGGWGAAGGNGYTGNSNYQGAAAGKAIALNGYTATRTGSGTTYGAVA